MVPQRSGSIINVASIEGLEGTEGGSAYNASKGAVVLLTKNMAIDYGRHGIRVNCVCPGFIETPMFESVMGHDLMAEHRERYREEHKLGRFGRPEEIAGAALFLAVRRFVVRDRPRPRRRRRVHRRYEVGPLGPAHGAAAVLSRAIRAAGKWRLSGTRL